MSTKKQPKKQSKKPIFEKIKTQGKNYGVLKQKRAPNKDFDFIAYDLETTPIKEGTPEVLYLTAYGKDFYISTPLESIHHLKAILLTEFLTYENRGRPFVAWNANKFDTYFIAMALLTLGDEYLLRPYLAKNNALRGLGVVEFPNEKKEDLYGYRIDWQFLDGMAMTGAQIKLKDFVKTFAPDHAKLDIGLSKGTVFDPENKEHIEYANRDSEALYHAMDHCNLIIKNTTGLNLTTTIANLGIKYFQTMIPEGIKCYMPPPDARDACYDYLMRGGFCYCAYKYDGPTWKYDINQAYAAAMRDAKLPAGRCAYIDLYTPEYPAMYLVNATHPTSTLVPFYYKPLSTGMGVYTFDQINQGWITSIEYEQLKNEGWQIEIIEGYCWETHFNMRSMVDNLEQLRHSDPAGPKGPIGSVAKYMGNNSYGKLCERLNGEEIVMALTQPEGYILYRGEDPEMDKIWVTLKDPLNRVYHRPQIAAFITAHVRMIVRQAALLGGEHWVYADTDCVAYTKPIEGLNIDPKAYGAWKQETNGERYLFVTKKVYAKAVWEGEGEDEGEEMHAKGMRIKSLTRDDFKEWYKGNPPEQMQTQKRNLIQVLSGFDMYVTRRKVGQKM